MESDEQSMAKRAHGTGSVTEYKDGFLLKWYDLNGNRGSKVVRPATEKEANRVLRGILADLDRGVYHDDRKGAVRFDAFAKDWLEWKEPQVKHSTFKNYAPLLKTTILPMFGAKRLNQITPRVVDIWWAKHAAHPVNRRNAYFLLRGILKQAVKWGLLAAVPIDVENAGADVSKSRPDWTLADFDAVLEHVDAFYKPALEIMLSGHFRLGELIALNHSDVRKGFVTANKQKTGGGYTADTKTGQHGTVELMARGKAALAELPVGIGDTPLFPGEKAHRMPRASLQKAWNDACEAAGYSNFHIHDLRHIGLSLVAESGADRKVIQQRARHASATSTDRYIHTTKAQHAKAVADVDALISQLQQRVPS